MTNPRCVRDLDGERRYIAGDELIEAARAAIAADWRSKRPRVRLNNSQDSEARLQVLLADSPRERFGVLFLDCRNRVIDWRIMFEGTLDSAMVYPREIARACLENNAASIILAHNHPSGVAEPSQADHLITERIRKCVELLDVRVVDHFIVTPHGCASLARLGAL